MIQMKKQRKNDDRMKKKVLFVINTLGHAGAEMALLELFRRLSPQEYEISLFVLMGQGELVDRLPEHVTLVNDRYCNESVLSVEGQKHLRSTVIRSAFMRGNGIRLLPYMIRNAWNMIIKHKLQADKLLWRLISDSAQRLDEEYDMAVAYLEGGSAYYVIDHVKARKKVGFIHIDYRQAGYTRALDRDCYLHMDRVFTVSEEARDSFVKAYPECESRTYLFHNLLNREMIEELSNMDEGFQDDYEGLRLLTVGRLNYQKAYDVAIEAMQVLKSRNIDARWYVIGEGSSHKELQRQINEAGLQEAFILLGAKSNPYPYYSQCDIYIHATRFEGKSIAIQEAQILGCGIIASDCSGNRHQIIPREDGLLCELNPEAIADTVEEYINDAVLYDTCAKNAQKKQLSHEEEIDRLLELMRTGK